MSLLKELEAKIRGMTAEDKAALAKLAKRQLDAVFLPNPGPQTDALNSAADILLYGGSAGGGKRLDVETLVPTPSGWATMAEIKVGDLVFSADGSVAKVTAVSEIAMAERSFDVVFDTGEVITADGEHLWETMTDADRACATRRSDKWKAQRRASRPSRAVEVSKKPWVSENISRINRERKHLYLAAPSGAVRTTDEIAATLVDVRGRTNHSVAVSGALQSGAGALPIDPYLFGLWLGDGTSASGTIGMSADDISEVLKFVDNPVVSRKIETKNRNRPFEIVRFERLQTRLRALGVLGDKRIPISYLRGSVGERTALLQGLMDTDGTVDKRGQCELALSKRDLLEDAHHLLASLGIKSTIRSRNVVGGNTSYRVKFVAEFAVFRLPRKAVRQKTSGLGATTKRRYIVDVRAAAPRLMRCIAVDHPSHLYLVGRSCIATHNSALMVGCAASDHHSALILRREAVQLDGLFSFAGELVVSKGWDRNKVDKAYASPDGRVLKFAGLNEPDDWRKYAGIARDFYGFDEAGEFLEEQVASLIGWLRTTREGQRCRVILASNPPRGGDGQWLLVWFAPWLDPMFPNPANPGELRWAIRVNGVLEWVDGPGVYERGEEHYEAQSLTFIPASLVDNPYLADSGYRARLQNLPEPLRSQLLYGDFTAGREDHERQVIPSAWVDAANERWERNKGSRLPMTSLGVDVAQGGKDKTVLAPLHRHRFEDLIIREGTSTPDGPAVATQILAARRNDAVITIDLTGGWGGSARDHLRTHHEIHAVPFVASEASGGTTADLQLSFLNLRAESWWVLRESLDPSTGPDIELPPNPKLKAELTAPTWMLKGSRIQVESKDEIRKRLGSSTDHADAVIMAWFNRGRSAMRDVAKRRDRLYAVAEVSPLAGF